jgi:putative transposase
MARPYSMDLREQAMERLASGQSAHQVAAALRVAASSVIKWANRQRRLGSVAPGRMGGRRPYLISGDHRIQALAAIAKNPHVTLHQLAAMLKAWGLAVHPASVGRFLKREGKSFKKNHSSGRTDQAEAGAAARTMAALSGQD